jgi:hypothetical protein
MRVNREMAAWKASVMKSYPHRYYTLFILFLACFTTLTLAGSVMLIFFFTNDVLNMPAMTIPDPLRVPLSFLIFPVPFAAGWLWGGGTARLVGQPAKPVGKKMALSWGASVFVVGLLLDFSQTPVFSSSGALRNIGFPRETLHYLFTLVFAPAVGLVTGWNVWRLLQALGWEVGEKEVARQAGVWAALAFLAASLVLFFGLGWEVGGPFAGRKYNMIGIMHVCNACAALAGGWILGRAVVKGPAVLPEEA